MPLYIVLCSHGTGSTMIQYVLTSLRRLLNDSFSPRINSLIDFFAAHLLRARTSIPGLSSMKTKFHGIREVGSGTTLQFVM